MARKDLLTPAEHQIMVYLWKVAKENPKFILVRSILDRFPEENRPAYTTLATFVKILSNKKFIDTKKIGNLLTIRPNVSQETYMKRLMKYNVSDFFDDDPMKMIEFMIKNSNLSDEQKEALKAKL